MGLWKLSKSKLGSNVVDPVGTAKDLVAKLNQEVPLKKEYALELFGIARSDFISARALKSASDPGRLENVLYFVQQSVEKCIKAVLVHRQISFPLVQDLGSIIALLPDPDLPSHRFNLTELNPFATVRRYEEGPLPLTKEEVEIALETADDIVRWAGSIISK